MKLLLSMFVAVSLGACSILMAQQSDVWAHVVISMLKKLELNPISLGSMLLIPAAQQLFIIPLLTAGTAFGFLRQHYKGSPWWLLAPLIGFIPFAAFASLTFMFFLPIASLRSGNLMDWPAVIVLNIVALLCLYGSLFAAEYLFKQVAERTSPWRIFLPGLIAIGLGAPAWMLQFNSMLSGTWLYLTPTDGLLLAGAGFFASIRGEDRTMGRAATATALCCFPFFLCSVGRIASAVVLPLRFHTNGWLSISVAGLISGEQALFAVTGALIGFAIRGVLMSRSTEV